MTLYNYLPPLTALTWTWTCPEMLEMSTPAGARRARLAVELSRRREWPAGDLTAFVARESLESQSHCEGGEGGSLVLLHTQSGRSSQSHLVRPNHRLAGAEREQDPVCLVPQLKQSTTNLQARVI